MANNTHIAHLIIGNKPVFVKHVWKDNDQDLFHIKVFYEDNTWSGKFSNEMAEARRTRVDETEEEYANNVLECLNGDSNNYVFNFVSTPDKADAATFTWKKRFEGALLVHGSVPLERDAVPESKDLLLQSILDDNKRLSKEIQASVKQNDQLIKDSERYRTELESCIQDHSDVYSSLYCKFVQVLNEKKKRIQELTELQQP